jgi:putative hemolysin
MSGRGMKDSTFQDCDDTGWYNTTPKLIDLNQAANNPSSRLLLYFLKSPLENLLSLKALNRVYEKYYEKTVYCKDLNKIFHLGLDALNVTYSVTQADLQKIPPKGPLVVVANHPFGALEGVILGAVLLKVRPDLKILGNYLLKNIVGIRDTIISVDPFVTGHSAASNLKGLKEAMRWVKGGGLLATFPAGEVSSVKLTQGRVIDPVWSSHIGGIIRRTRAAALPVYFPGRNSVVFQLLGLLHPGLRTALLPRELINKKNKQIKVHIGRAFPWRKLQRFETDAKIMDYLRVNTYFLRNRACQNKIGAMVLPFKSSSNKTPEPIIKAVSPSLLQDDIAALPAEQRLVQNGDMDVYIARASQIPNILNEIGRLRELTFRQVQEGTGKALDLDRFDAYYLHLFVWNHKKRELVGAYRLGLADKILKSKGAEGLYTSTLFRFKPEFVDRLKTAIETGRSFIRSEYQKKFNSLVLLWRGIGEFIARNPHYKILFGPVSISKSYHAVSKNLIVRFLKTNNLDPRLARFVSARNSFRSGRIEGLNRTILKSSFQDIDDISLLISEIESDGKGVPILLRHYLKLNGRLISFNSDRAFSRVVDGLLLVDLTKTDPKILKRFMGEKGYESITRYPRPFPEKDPSDDPEKYLDVTNGP